MYFSFVICWTDDNFYWAKPSFNSFSLFSSSIFTRKMQTFGGIRAWIAGVEGNHADHWTTTTTYLEPFLPRFLHSKKLQKTLIFWFGYFRYLGFESAQLISNISYLRRYIGSNWSNYPKCFSKVCYLGVPD